MIGTNWKTFHANIAAKAARDPAYRKERAVKQALARAGCRKKPVVSLAPVGKTK